MHGCIVKFIISLFCMTQSFDIWKLLAGVAIFLLGMKFLEESLQQLAGRRFKLFLKKQTASKPKAIFGGAVVTGILQSSSVVNLMVLAFVGANVIQMQNALAVILGANLGTTFDSWIVATVGFKLNIENIAYPLSGVFGIIMSLSSRESRWHKWSKFLFGFGFLFIGLNYMKTGMLGMVQQLHLSAFKHYLSIIFLLLGFIITSLIQSSSATVAIVLSALHANAIGLFAATAIVLGSEVGTTIKLLLAAVKGIAAKKRVALGNLLFNSITVLLAFIFLAPLNRLITDVFAIKDNLMGLVFFQSLINLLGIMLFYPFLNLFGKFLEKRFVTDDDAIYISKIKPTDTELAAAALKNEVKHFMLCAIAFIRAAFEIPGDKLMQSESQKNHKGKSLPENYDYLKQLHGEIHGYAIRVQNNITEDKESMLLTEQLQSASRNSMYAAKSIKDALPDITQLYNSSNDSKYNFYKEATGSIKNFCKQINDLLTNQSAENSFESLKNIYASITNGYTLALEQLYNDNLRQHLNEVEISTLLNFNREMYTGCKSLLFAVKDYLLDAEQAGHFDELPGFIR
jgi:phosphate:Na+ symporter